MLFVISKESRQTEFIEVYGRLKNLEDFSPDKSVSK